MAARPARARAPRRVVSVASLSSISVKRDPTGPTSEPCVTPVKCILLFFFVYTTYAQNHTRVEDALWH